MWIHDLNARYLFNDNLMVYGGARTVTEEEPFISNFAYPAGPRGRFFCLGVDYQM